MPATTAPGAAPPRPPSLPSTGTGLPPTRGPALRDYKKVTFYLEAPLWERLAQLARDEFRRVDDQAGYLVRLALTVSDAAPPGAPTPPG